MPDRRVVMRRWSSALYGARSSDAKLLATLQIARPVGDGRALPGASLVTGAGGKPRRRIRCGGDCLGGGRQGAAPQPGNMAVLVQAPQPGLRSYEGTLEAGRSA